MFNFSIYYLRFFNILICILCFLNILYSYYFDLYLNVDSYFYTLLLSTLPLASFLFQKKNVTKISIYTKIISVILGYLILPLFIALPYYFSIYNITFLNAYFESVSGFTSTGFTVFDNIKHLDESLILWRSSSQWLGGLYFLFSIILLIDIFDDNLKKTLTNFLAFNSAEIFKQLVKIFIFYSFLTILIFIVLNLFDFRSFISLNLSMTLISSGGFLPVNNLEAILTNQTKIIIFSLLMLISFFSLFFLYNLLVYKKKGIKFIQEDIYLIAYLITLIFGFFLLVNKDINFSIIFLSISSSISNIGLSSKSVPNNLYFIFLILVIIGGSFFSTSSGLRFIKIFTLIKFSINELLSHSRPRQVYLSKIAFSKDYVNQVDINKYFLSILIFVVSLFTVTILLTVSNLNFDTAFKLGILSIMNTVNSSMHGLGDFYFLKISYLSKITLIFFMIIGRVELLTFLIIAKKFLFKN